MTMQWKQPARPMRKPGAFSNLLILFLLATLAACHDDGGSSGGNSNTGGDSGATYTIGGTVTGLRGSGLRLRNGATDLAIAADGAFSFPIALASGTAYSVTVVTQPTSPVQVCTVSGGSGTVTASNVASIAIACTTTAFTVGGGVSGLKGSGLKLNDGTEDLPIAADGAFSFPTALANGTAYSVTVVTQPSSPAQICTVSSGVGSVDASNVTDVDVTCRTRLTLSSSTPPDGSTSVSRTFSPVLTFSAQLDATTVSTNSVTLVSAAGAPETVTLQVSFKQITVTPTRVLAPLMSYTLTASTDVRGVVGELSDSPLSTTFTTSERSWQSAGALEENDGRASVPQIAANASGNAVAVWLQTEGTRTRVWSAYYRPGDRWSSAAPIQTTSGNASVPQVAIDAQGNALAVWVQTSSNGLTSLESNRYSSGGWAAAASIETDVVGDASEPQVAFDANGNALAVWTRAGKIWSIRRPAGSGWTREERIEDANTATTSSQPQIAVNARGDALAVWQENGFNRDQMRSNHYTAGTGWGTVAAIGTNSVSAVIRAPQIAIDANGNGLAVWQQFDDGAAFTDILSNRYTPGTGWSTARSITTDKTRDAGAPQIAIDRNGNALAVWQQGAANANGIIWWARYPAAGSDWETAAPIGAIVPFATMADPQIAFDAAGNASAVWSQYISGQDLAFNIVSSRYAAGTWGAVELIETDVGEASLPQVAVDANGNALAVWQQSDGTRDNIMVNRFE